MNTSTGFSTSSNDTVIQCEVSKYVLTPWYFRVLIILEIIVAAQALLPNALFCIFVGKQGVFPANLRLLLCHFGVMLFWYGLGQVVKNLYLLLAPVCGFEMDPFWCTFMDLACTKMALPIFFYTLLALCCERFYASIRYKHYEKTAAKKPWLSSLLIISSWLCAFGIHGSVLFECDRTVRIAICEPTFVPLRSFTIYSVYIFLEITGVILTVCIYSYTRFVARNMAINRAKFDLSSRFQLDQNVRVNAIIVPSMILHAICHIPAFAVTIAIRGGADLNLDTKLWLTRVVSLWRISYTLVHAILAFNVNRDLTKEVIFGLKIIFGKMKSLGHVHNKVQHTQHGTHERHVHFHYLNKQWDHHQARHAKK